MFSNSWFRSPLDVLGDGLDIVSNAISDAVDSVQEFSSEVSEKVQNIAENVTMMDVVKYGPLLPMTLINEGIDALDTNGYYRVFRHGIAHDLVGEGLPSAVGFVGDVGVGIWDSAVDLVTEGDLTNPFNRVTRSDGYTARMARWGSEYIGQPLADLYDAGDVKFRKPEDGNGMFDWEYTVDDKVWRDADAGVQTLKVLSNVADIAIPAAAVTKLRYFGTIGRISQNVGLGGMAGGMTGIAMDALDRGDANDLIRLFNDPDKLDSERGIRLLQRRLNEVNKGTINASIDRVEKLQREVRDGDLTGQEAEDAMGMKATSFLDDNGALDQSTAIAFRNASDIISQRDVLKTDAMQVSYHYSIDKVQVYDSVLALEEKFYNLSEEYLSNPEGFAPSQSDILAMQMWMTGDSGSRFLSLGQAGKEATLEALDEYLEEMTSEYVPNAVDGASIGDSFNMNAQDVTVQDFIDHRQEVIGTERAVVSQKLDDLYMQKIESQQYMPVM